ncbi:hypothetical protein C1Y40_04839 [Mycobacterium talmoniae]|uniref:HTH cro/C1-type domain-containing protein n=1 Tax=Mycobacterium talmoniae TaxID=1858794 RepID=A0A2S8BEA5_9MYCO|nr:helix-turn-helix transcriptional regulator [Mycobacterium eburneum]PQM45000.1 hypothetical protein C1Y40_04839 [Mycobacterium talmoniae]TDH48126.1 transcriptional regulator [Mycobacterium eburneum]
MSHRVVRGFQRDRLIELREQAKMTPAELARLADLSPSTVASWERRDGAPDVARLVKVAEVLEVDFSELVDVPREEQMPSDLRIRKGLSQVELARQIGLSTTVIGTFERAEKRWNVVQASKIAAVLGVDIDDLHEAWLRARRRPPGTPA